ncbi:MAG: hypothetical protein WC053_03605 [Sideroxydans sp.]|jgi:uncharacterized membrane protein YdjX (TVP38/TMEM64 family)
MNSINNNMVLWGVIISVVGTFLVGAWLLFMAYRKATKDNDEDKK